jgi:hypothetical protein
MKKKKDKELKIRKISISPLPEEEKKRTLFKVFDILFSQNYSSNKNKKIK